MVQPVSLYEHMAGSSEDGNVIQASLKLQDILDELRIDLFPKMDSAIRNYLVLIDKN